MKQKLTKTLILGTVLMGYLGLAACNTMEGAGKDVKTGGEKLEKSAQEHK